jgi:hypothetical protein
MTTTNKSPSTAAVATPAHATKAAKKRIGSMPPNALLPMPPTPPPPPTPTSGPNAALAAYVAQALAALDGAEAGLPADPTLTPAEKRHATKLRKGGEPIVTLIGALARQYQLESPVLHTDQMLADLEQAQILAPLTSKLLGFAKHVSDLTFGAQSSAWEMALQLYAVLQRRAQIDGSLAANLAPATEFLAYRHKSTKPAGTPTKRQRKATTKAVNTLAKMAPDKLAPGAAPVHVHAAVNAPAPAPAANEAPANGASTNGAAGNATHS